MNRTYAVETFGCQMNMHDSERLGGLLQQAGYAPAASVDDADMIVVNTCSVRERAAEKLFARLDRFRHKTRDERPLIAVTGCVAQQEGSRIVERAPMVDIVIGTQALAMLPAAVEEAERTRRPQVDTEPYANVSFPLGVAIRENPVKAFVTVIEGCNDFCAFCVVPYTRGHERMRPVAEIIAEVSAAAAAGHREVHLLGQIVNHYQAPDAAECDFAGLLERVHAIDGIDRIRFASPHPRHVTPRMVAAIRDLPKVCKHLHLPVQSGSTRVLGRMRRRHTRERYLSLIEEIRAQVSGVSLSTDMIVGFPGETPEDFEQTLSLTETVRYHGMFSFKYSERPNTLARARMPDDVPESEKARRLTALQTMQQGIQRQLHDSMVGRTVTVLADTPSRRRAGEYAGRTSGNTVVNFPGDPTCIGRLLDVRVERAGPNSLWGTLSPAVQPPPSGGNGVG